MAKFLDGPAKDVYLNLRRTPQLLRVVHDSETWEWDALDQIEDHPKPTERIYVYQREGDPMRGIMCSRGRGGGCHPFIDADYRIHPQQPEDATLRDREAWQAWALEQSP